MKEKADCQIVRDLLPNYIEKLTSDETNQYIEKHLKECSECEKIFENMKKELKVNTEKRDNREVKYIKKYNNKIKILKITLLIIILIYTLLIGRKAIITFSLSTKATENLTKSNYYAKLNSYQGDTLTITETYNKGEDYLTTVTRLENGKTINKLTYYKKDNEKITLSDYNGQKNILNPENTFDGKIRPVTNVLEGFMANLAYAFTIEIKSTDCNGKECYVITRQDNNQNYIDYIDKETGLEVRKIDKLFKGKTKQKDIVVDYEYKFDTVKDSDIIKPDLTGYTINN